MSFRTLFPVLLMLLLALSSCRTASGPVPNPELEKMPRQRFSTPEGTFGLGTPEGMQPFIPDSVPWTVMLQRPEGNAAVIYYFPRATRPELIESHIAVEYMAKSLPGCATVDTLFGWLKSVHINPDRKGVLVDDQTEVATLDNQIVRILQIRTPQIETIGDDGSPVRRGGKQLAWAYVDHGQYFIGMNLSVVDSTQYPSRLEQFKQVLGSYRKE